MNQALGILRALNRIMERAAVFRHGREDVFEEMNFAEVHCIDWIGRIDHANVTRIASEMGMTRGAICKICKKLLQKEMVDSYQEPNNNKEIYYTLTNKGQRIHAEHARCHAQAQEKKLSILQAYGEQEQAAILRFLDDMNRWLDGKLTEDGSGNAGSSTEDLP